jgi:hypothetical protein
MALQSGDLSEFSSCLSRLLSLAKQQQQQQQQKKKKKKKRTHTQEQQQEMLRAEFIGYQILYYVYTKNWLDLNIALAQVVSHFLLKGCD